MINTIAFAAALKQNPQVADEVRATLKDLIPQMVRLNSALFAGCTNVVIEDELKASAALTSALYHLAEALDAQPAAEEKPKAPRKQKEPKPTPVDPNNTPQPLEELPEHGASVVGEPTDSAKEDAK